MSRILRRPMFRMGGSTGTGIMSGLDKPRKRYATGSSLMPGTVPGFLTDYSVNLLSTPPTGNIFQTAATTAKKPLSRFQAAQFQKKQAEDKFAKDLALVLAKPKTPTTKNVTNISDKTIAGVAPGKTGLVTNEDIVNNPGAFRTPPSGGLDIQFNKDGSIKSISEGTKPTDAKFKTQAMELKNSTFAMNNVATTLLKNLKGAKVGPVGGTITALDSVSSQLKQLADATGFTNNFVNTGSGKIDDYLRKNLGEGIFADSVQYGKIRSNAINLAYLMARVDEPGGRFTDRDIALKMEEIGIGANPQRTAQILANAVDLRNKNASFAYKQLTDGEELNFEGFTLPSQQQKGKKGTTDNNPAGLDLPGLN